MAYECRNWSACYDYVPGPGEGLTLHVSGECECDWEGYEFELRVGDQGINPDPRCLNLDLLVREANRGPAVVTTSAVRFADRVGDTYRRVVIQGGTVDVEVATLDAPRHRGRAERRPPPSRERV